MRRAAPVPARGLLAAAVLAAAFAAADAAWGQAAGPNLSSHDARFFTDLLSGRVWVLERPNSARASDRNTIWAHYHAPDGTLLACAHLGGAHAAGTARWRVVASRAFRSLYNYLEPGAEPDPGRRKGHTPLFYDPRQRAAAQRGGLGLGRAVGGRVHRLGAGELAPLHEGGVPRPRLAGLASGQPEADRDGLRRDDGAGSRSRAPHRAGRAPARAGGGRHRRRRGPSDADGGGARAFPDRERRLRARPTPRARATCLCWARKATSSGCLARTVPSPPSGCWCRRRAAPRSRCITSGCRCVCATGSAMRCPSLRPASASPPFRITDRLAQTGTPADADRCRGCGETVVRHRARTGRFLADDGSGGNLFPGPGAGRGARSR